MYSSQELLFDTLDHGLHYTHAHSLREASVVLLHVVSEVFEIHGLFYYREGVVLAVSYALLIVILFQYVLNHCFTF